MGAGPLLTRFNVAMTFQSWIASSTGPRTDRPTSFNVAMTFQSWIGFERAFLGIASIRFNVAMTFQSWIVRARPEPRLGAGLRLQCGHDLSVMDRTANIQPQ